MLKFEKVSLSTLAEAESFSQSYAVDIPIRLPCVAVLLEIDPDPRPTYHVVEYVYETDFKS